MKLTKLQRHTAYIIMRETLKRLDESQCFLCYAADLIGLMQDHWDAEYFKIVLPELYDKKPTKTDSDDTWFSCGEKGKQTRIEIVTKCIQETA